MLAPLLAMEPVCRTDEIRRVIQEHSQEIVDEVILEIWRRPSLSYFRMLAEWELRTWLLGMLNRFGGPEALGFVHFSRPFLWDEAVATIPILLRKTCEAIKATPETEADLRRYLNLHLIRRGEFYDGGWGKSPTRAIYPPPRMP